MVLELLKAFVRKPFQEKYIPVFAALLMGVILIAVAPVASSFLVATFLFISQIFSADRPLNKVFFYGYLLLGALATSSAVMFILVGAFKAFLLGIGVASLPVSIVFTRPQQEKIK